MNVALDGARYALGPALNIRLESVEPVEGDLACIDTLGSNVDDNISHSHEGHPMISNTGQLSGDGLAVNPDLCPCPRRKLNLSESPLLFNVPVVQLFELQPFWRPSLGEHHFSH